MATGRSLLVLLVTVAGGLLYPSDSPAQFVPGKRGISGAWREYLTQPFARDTLARLVGERLLTVESFRRPPPGRPNLRGQSSISRMALFEEPNDETFAHEIGHVVDVRQRAPHVSSALREAYNQRRRPGDGEHADAEYVAEAFRAAVGVLRAGSDRERKLLEAERAYPGAKLWLKWLESALAVPASTPASDTSDTTPP